MDHEQTSGCAYKPPEQLTQRTTEPGTAHAAVVDDRWASKLDSQRGGLKLRDEEADCRWQSVSCDTGEGASLHQQKLQQQAASISTDEQQRQQQGVAAAAAGYSGIRYCGQRYCGKGIVDNRTNKGIVVTKVM